MTPIAVLDANVLFPMLLRDTLLRVAAAGCFRAHWSARILEEMVRNLVAQHRVTAADAARLMAQMNAAFDEASIEGWEALEEGMPNEPKDRHVAAVAVHAGADLIVTENLRDFEVLPGSLRAIGADEFLTERLAASPDVVVEALRKQARGYRRPPASLAELLAWLERDVPGFAAAVQKRLGGLATL